VSFDGVRLTDADPTQLRARIAFVPQDVAIFATSIAENIGFGRAGASDAEVKRAAELALADEFIARLPQGYATAVGERGVTLSGGQKQRTAIARAVAKEPRMLILDDALSSVDTRTEEAVLEGLQAFMTRRTSIVIAHRLSTTRSAERVIVLDKGRIVEQGTHAELVQRGGLYTRMYRRQLIAQELELEEEEDGALVEP
jgi:ATP-binding cassette subfamily B protein